MVYNAAFGEAQIIRIRTCFQKKIIDMPYLRGIPNKVSFGSNGISLVHGRLGKGKILAYIVVFRKIIMPISYPSAFVDGTVLIV